MNSHPGQMSPRAALKKTMIAAAMPKKSSWDDVSPLDARSVNREERSKAKKRKDAAKRRRTGVGLHAVLAQEIRRRHPGDVPGQIAEFLDRAALPAATGESREVAEKTRGDYGYVLQQSFAQLREMRIQVEDFTGLKRGQVLRLVARWHDEGKSPDTVKWRVSILRRFLTLIGKEHVVPRGVAWRKMLEEKGLDEVARPGSNLADMPKGWVDMGFDATAIIAAIAVKHPVVACALEMMWRYGLRFSEVVQLQPRVSDKNTHLSVYRGTKGGKLREVPMSGNPEVQDLQRDVLERAKQLADRHPKGLLAEPGLKLTQTKNRWRYVLRKHGICKAGLGITPHGLRHQFGTDLFKELTGLPAPVLEQVPQEVYVQHADDVREAMFEISRQMGHERPSISGAYLSSVPKMHKVEVARLADWLERLGTCDVAFEAAGIKEAWVVGKAAFGLPLGGNAALQVAVRMDALDERTRGLLLELASGLHDAAGVRVAVNPWLDTGRPEEGAEILFGRGAYP